MTAKDFLLFLVLWAIFAALVGFLLGDHYLRLYCTGSALVVLADVLRTSSAASVRVHK